MKSATRRGRLVAWVAVMAILVAGGLVLSGCTPAEEETPTPPSGPGPGVVDTPTGPEGTPEAEGEAKPEADAKPEAEAKPEADAKPEAEGETKPEAEAKAEAKRQAKPSGEAAAKTEEMISALAEPPSGAAAAPAAPKVSEYAPAADLASQVPAYIEDFEEAVENEEEYKDSAETLAKHANTLILIALALGLHDSDNQYKAAAPAMIQAGQQLAAAKDYASAKAAVEAVKAAATSTGGDTSGLKWEKVASLHELMEAVPLINTRLKRYARKGREKRTKDAADELAGYAAVLAVIAQGSMANSDETEKPKEVEKWLAFCVEMRDAAAVVNKSVRTFEKEETPEAFEGWMTSIEGLAQSCDHCHEVFHQIEE